MVALRPLRRVLASSLALLLLALCVPNAVQAQEGKEATSIRIGAPEHADLGGRIVVQAMLADSAGKPIAQAAIYFVSSAKFLGASSDMTVAQGVTDARGQAVADFENHVDGPLSLRAQFRGDDHYAPSDASTQINIAGDQQVYVEHVGVHIPGLNQAPPEPAMASLDRPFTGVTPGVQALWPSLSGWPIALVLMTVWSLYLFVVVLIFRLVAPSPPHRGGYNVETGRFE